jgi:hypothetical protein
VPTGLPRARPWYLMLFVVLLANTRLFALMSGVRSGSKTLNRVLTAGECRTTDDEIECGRNQGSTGIVLLAETCRLRLIAL